MTPVIFKSNQVFTIYICSQHFLTNFTEDFDRSRHSNNFCCRKNINNHSGIRWFYDNLTGVNKVTTALLLAKSQPKVEKVCENLLCFRGALAYIYVPVVQRELHIFKKVVWNHGKGRKQKEMEQPTGRPSFIYANPKFMEEWKMVPI